MAELSPSSSTDAHRGAAGKTHPTDKRAAALAWAARGFRVFPLVPWTKIPRKKHEGDESWTQTADNDPAYVWNTWTGPNGEALNYNIGVLTTDLCVADIDMKNGRNGWASFTSHGGSVDTLMVRTPTGGYHAYYCGALVANGVDRQDGIDIRGHHGYVIAPGSELPEGTYELVSDQPVNLAPDWLVDIAKPVRHRHEKADIPLIDLDQPAAIALAAVTMRDAPLAIIGERDQRAYDWACQMRDLGVSEAVALSVMVDWAARSLIPLTDLQEKVQNAYLYAQNQAGSKSPLLHFAGVDFESLRLPEQPRPSRPAIRLYSPAQCAEAPPRGYLVKGMLAPRDVGCIFGQPGAGKSIVAPHIGYAVAQGRSVFGCRTRQGLVFYVAAEDPTGMRQRVTGLRLRHGDADGFQLVEGVSNLLDAEQRKELAALVAQHQPALIMIDTVAMAFPGTDENASRDMGQIVAVARELTGHGAAVVLIHHQPKDGGDTPRGHSLLNGALDMSLMLTKDDEKGICQGRLKKNRNGSCDLNQPVAFRIRSTELGRDEDGDPVTAPIAEELSKRDLAEEKGAKLSKSEAECLRVLCGRAGGQGHGAEGVAEASWQEACEAVGAGSGSGNAKNRRDSFRRTLRGLEGKGAIAKAAGGFVATMSGDLHNAAAQFSGAAIPPVPGQKTDQTSRTTKMPNEQNAGEDVPPGPLLH